MQHFVAVAQELHFRRAAQLANVAQPALSRSVQTLENELGVQLLARNNRNVKLTPAGKEFLAGSTAIIEAMDSTIKKTIRAGQAGGVNLGYTYIAMGGKLASIISAFEAQYPDTKIEALNASSAKQIENLHHEEMDCCFLTGPVKAQEIETAVVQADAFNVIVNSKHPLASNGSISLEQLAAENLLLAPEADASAFNQHVHRFFAQAQLEPTIEYIHENHVGILGKVALGRGVCVATEGYGFVYAKGLTALKITGTNATLPTVLAWRKDLHNADTICFINFVLTHADVKSTAQAKAPALTGEHDKNRALLDSV